MCEKFRKGTFARCLTEKMSAFRLDAQAVGELLSVSPEAVLSWQQGRTFPTAECYEALGNIFNIKEQELNAMRYEGLGLPITDNAPAAIDVADREAVSALVRQRRTDLGLSQKNVADAADVSRGTFALMESSSAPYRVSLVNADNMLRALGLKLTVTDINR